VHPYILSTAPGPPLLFLELEAMIAWPRDKEAQQRFLCTISGARAEDTRALLEVVHDEAAAESGRQWLEAWEGMFQRAGGRRTLLQAPSFEAACGAFLRASRDAWLAGHVLGIALQLANDPRTRALASINAAKEIVHRDLPARIPTVYPMPRSHRPVDDAWSSHRCVAPWASAISVIRASLYNEDPDGLRGNQILVDVTAGEVLRVGRTAAALEQLAAETFPRGRKEPLLPRSELLPLPLRINKFRKEDVLFHPLPDDVVASLRNRRKRRTFGGLQGA
jgi:hypothetical protein